MPYQETSRQVYQKIKPHLNPKQILVTSFFKRHPRTEGYTNAEFAFEFGWTINRVTPRTGELVKLGVLEKLNSRPCKRTGNMAHPLRYIKSVEEVYV